MTPVSRSRPQTVYAKAMNGSAARAALAWSRHAALPLLAASALLGGPAAPLAGESVRDVLGSAHAGGTYNFTTEDYLDEGADRLLGFGTRVIKVWLTPDVVSLYPFNSVWSPPPTGALEVAQTPYFRSLFAKPFTTYLLVVEPVTRTPLFLQGMTDEDIAAESGQMFDLASYLLTTYAGSGKTFVLQNWEGDHLLRAGLAPDQEPDPVRRKGMIDWWNARQDGVSRARAAVGENGVRVAHAVEVNQLADAMAGKVTCVNDIVPYTGADLYSYSSWDIQFDPATLTQALDYLRSKAPPSALFGARNIYLGEYGAAKDEVPAGEQRRDLIDRLTDAALGWGVRYAVYWQVFCNEPFTTLDPLEQRPLPDQLHGFWLVRPDGMRAAWWPDLQRRLSSDQWRIALRAASGQYLSAPQADGSLARVSAWRAGPWETFNAVDSGDGGVLRGGARVALQAHSGTYLALSGRGELETRPRPPPPSAPGPALFELRKRVGSGPLADGDDIVLETADGRPLVVDFATGKVFVGTASRGGEAAVFHLTLLPP